MSNYQNNISYTKAGDYYLPNLYLPEEMKQPITGHWGRLKLRYLQEHDQITYQVMLLNGTLSKTLNEMNDRAQAYYVRLVQEMKITMGATESLKAEDGMAWVRLMNNIDRSARDIVLQEIVFSE